MVASTTFCNNCVLLKRISRTLSPSSTAFGTQWTSTYLVSMGFRVRDSNPGPAEIFVSSCTQMCDFTF